MPVEVTDCPMRPITKGPENHFFGYYDKSPWNNRGDAILAHRCASYNRMPATGEAVEIGVIDEKRSEEFRPVAKTRAWNFQQGAMAQWVSGEHIIFNNVNDGTAVATLVRSDGSVEARYDRPIATISASGSWAVSINFGRLSQLKPEYGYAGLSDVYAGSRLPVDDGLWRLDLKSGRSDLLLPLSQIAAMGPDGDSGDAVHYLNHPMVNRTDDRICFLHRHINRAGTQHTRLFSCRPDGSELTLLISGMASHAAWRNASELLAWAGERAMLKSAATGFAKRLPVGKILKILYRALGKPALLKTTIMNDRYIVFDHDSGTRRDVVRGILRTDGHCSFSPDGEWFVTDTYPDRNGLTSLFIVRWKSEQVIKIKEFLMPTELDNEVRCDLHPRWHPTAPIICVDSAHLGSRQMYQIDVSEVVRSA